MRHTRRFLTNFAVTSSRLTVRSRSGHGPTVELKCDGTRAETRFRLSAKRASPFKSSGSSVQSNTGSRDVRISGSNAGYTMFRGSVKSTGYPLLSPVSPSLPLPASPYTITFQLESTTGTRGQLKCNGTRADTRFLLSAKRTSPFKSARVASVQSTAGSRGVRISGSNAGYTMFRGSVKGHKVRHPRCVQ